ncbi:uncharacterized protein [Macrobrachium rosenbergii]|uniref:uncharacterized protein n=1 Tax=Macrobrachium rosenbergii TaxID=79674 RepID=UPI0034D473F4
MDDNVKTQESQGIIEKIPNLDQFFQEHPEHSFMAHMGVFKLSRETTKCRMVFLSNLCEKRPNGSSISHNQAMWPGPCINQKLSIALLHLRFDQYLLCFDLKQAFLQIALNEVDQNKLLFLWFKNVSKGDFTPEVYKNLRLSFGLRCSPTLLMVALYIILMIDVEHDSEQIRELKKLIYALMYMDNGAVTANDYGSLKFAFDHLNSIFAPYKFELQQFVTNNQNIQDEINDTLPENVPDTVKLFGLRWNRQADSLLTQKLHLEISADTKRLVLKSIASNFDPYNINGPILNRARIFMHELQTDKLLGWDTKLPENKVREWRNIVKQLNSTPELSIPRVIGDRNGCYRLIAYTDSSKLMYGVVVFIQDTETKQASFVLAKNRIVNKQLEGKSIPSLEFQAIFLGTETLIELKRELSGPLCVKPVNICELVLCTDSLVSLSWINGYVNKLEKMNKSSTFILNRLNQISKLCEENPVKYKFVSGVMNPADCITRCVSYKQLLKTTYFTGPQNLADECLVAEVNKPEIMEVIVPNPLAKADPINVMIGIAPSDCKAETGNRGEHLVPLDRFSDFQRIVRVNLCVLKFIHNIKLKLKVKYPDRFGNFNYPEVNLHLEAYRNVIR